MRNSLPMTTQVTPHPDSNPVRSAGAAALTTEAVTTSRQAREAVTQALVDRFAATGELGIPDGLREPTEAALRVLLRDELQREAHVAFVEVRRNAAGIDPGLDRAERGLSRLQTMVVEDGLSPLSDDQLAALLLCPTTLSGIGTAMDLLSDRDELPVRWRPPTEVSAASLPDRDERATDAVLTKADRETISAIAAVAAESGATADAIPAPLREALVATLTKALADEELRVQYRDAFYAEYEARIGSPKAVCPTVEMDIPVEDISARGLSGISDPVLYNLATNPLSLYMTSMWVIEHIQDGRAGTIWQAA